MNSNSSDSLCSKTGNVLCACLSCLEAGSQNDQKFNIQAESGLLTLTSAITNSDDRFKLDIVALDDGSCCGRGNTLSSTVRIFVQVSVPCLLSVFVQVGSVYLFVSV